MIFSENGERKVLKEMQILILNKIINIYSLQTKNHPFKLRTLELYNIMHDLCLLVIQGVGRFIISFAKINMYFIITG